MLRNREAYANAAFDWSALDGCFGTTKIMPTDIDGVIERKGRRLFLEAKPSGKDVPRGQARVFDSLVADGDHVLVFWHLPDKTLTAVQRWGRSEAVAGDISLLRDLVGKWYAWADSHPKGRA